jgi:hypothetical protein
MRPCRARPAMPGRGDRSAAGVRDRTDRIPRSAGSVPQRLSRAVAAPAVVHGSEEPQVTGLPARAARTICAGDSDYGPKVIQRPELTCQRPGFVDGQGSRPGGGGTPRAEAGAPAASGSRSWCRRRGGTARRWRPTRGRWPGRRRAAPRTAPVVAPEPPNRENRQRFLVLLFARLRLGTVGEWISRSWRPGPRRVPRCDPGGTAALGATGEVVPIELPAHGGGGRGQRLSPAPALVLGRSKDASSGLRAGSGARQR